MATEEKAKELVEKFRVEIKDMMMHGDGEDEIFYAKRCALICVDEKIETYLKNYPYQNELALHTEEYYYLEEVKQEINEL